MPATVVFLTRENCGLCEQAWMLIEQCGVHTHCSSQDIDADLALIRRFGERVPVLADAKLEQCLDWPFDRQAIHQFVEQLE